METLEELKAIIDNAPSDGRATHIDEIGDYIESNDGGDCWFDYLQWVRVEGPVCMRSLSDIKRIIELMEQVERLEDDMAASCAYCGAPAG